MLTDLGAVIKSAWSIMTMEFTIYGYTFSWWQVMLYLMISSFLIYFVVRLLHG